MVAAWILAGLSATCFILFAYPYAIYPRVLRLLSKAPINPGPTSLRPSLLFCAYNEIECLPRKISNLRELKEKTPELEIIVYDDASSDGTFELLSSVPDLLTTVRGPGRTGKAAGMRQLAQSARGDILIFTDADVIFAPDAIEKLMPYYADPAVGGVCCTVRMLSDADSVTGSVGSVYWDLDDKLQRLESATGNVMGASGAMFSVRRALYPQFPDTVQDDFTVSMSVIFASKRLIKAADVFAFTRGLTRGSEELRRKLRIGARAYHTHTHLRPQLRQMAGRDRFKYVSRKMVRWFGGLFLALGALFALAAIATVSLPIAAAALILGIIVTVAAVRSKRGKIGKAGQALAATFATLLGIFQGIRGRTVTTWAPVKTR